jgi:hypothetical protein
MPAHNYNSECGAGRTVGNCVELARDGKPYRFSRQLKPCQSRLDRPVSPGAASGAAASEAALPRAHRKLCAQRETDAFVNWEQDQHGDWHSRFVFPGKTEDSIDVDRISNMDVINPFDFFVEPYAEN